MTNLAEYDALVFSGVGDYIKYFDKDDLLQAGREGLVKACKKYDETRNIKFSTYAYKYILGEVVKYIRGASSVKVSRDLIKLNGSVERAKDLMRQRLGREPSIEEVSLFLDVDVGQIEEAVLATSEVSSLDATYDIDGEGSEFYNSIGTTDQDMDLEFIDLRSEISKLDSEERDLIISRYYYDLTQQETSNVLGISQVQTSRKEKKVLEKLRQRLT